jgi:acyl-CoA thioester hydrolase
VNTVNSVRAGDDICTGEVLPEWIDVNNHMNVAFYVLAFDRGVDTLWSRFGITDEYIREQKKSTFAVETHVTYQRELQLAEPYIVTSQLLAFDEKRIHQFMRLYHAENQYLSATAEWMNLHVDLNNRRVSPWPSDILENIREFAESQRSRSWPEEAGRRMRVPKPFWSSEDYS